MGSTYLKLCQHKQLPANDVFHRPKAVRASAHRQLRTDALDAVPIACIDLWTFATFLVFVCGSGFTPCHSCQLYELSRPKCQKRILLR